MRKVVFDRVPLLDLSRVQAETEQGYSPTYQWLWKPLGMSKQGFQRGAPGRLPLMQELRAALLIPRHKRSRLGVFIGPDDDLLPPVVDISVRGRSLRAAKDSRRLRVDLSKEGDMQWFVSELWQKLRADVAAARLPVAEAEDRAEDSSAPRPVAAN